MSTMHYGLVAGYALVVYRTTPSDGEFDAYTAFLAEHGARIKGILSVPLAGTGPTVQQRKQMVDRSGHFRTRLAIITESPMIRGTVRAVSWIRNLDSRAFSAAQMDAAFDYLGVAPEERAALRLALVDYKVKLDVRKGD